MIDNEYLLQEEITEDVTQSVMDMIQPQLKLLFTSCNLMCIALSQLVGDVETLKAELDGKSEKEIKEIKDTAEDLSERFSELARMYL